MHPKLICFSASVCIGAQIMGLYPAVLIPASTAAENKRLLFSSRTAVYVLGPGETTASVAKKFNLSYDDLKRLNSFRTYAREFDKLGTGDEVDIPVVSSSTPASISATTQPDSTTLWMSSAGVGLSSGNSGRKVSDMARGAATTAATGEVEKWLGQFGTARVALNVDDDFHLDGSEVDLLVPLYDAKEIMFFTQLGYRNKDDRNTLNTGIGLRYFLERWMFGVNTFFDNDLTGHNRRMGYGLEAWTDYLKTSVNAYYGGLTDWHQSRDFADYDERPADGFDVRTEWYLHSYPQLGGKLIYEQYQGDEVALFGKNNRQSDPVAVTLGVNYTPIPLVTLGLDYRQGESGQNDTTFTLAMTYRPGVAWQKQTDPAQVDAIRTLSATRYDLVERNNEIVLEYKKQNIISLQLPDSQSGESGTTGLLSATIESKYGLGRVEWQTGELTAAGGSSRVVSASVLEVTYPPFVSGGRNTYRVQAKAYDARGNASNIDETELRVTEPAASIISGDLTVIQNNAPADGTTANTVQAKVTSADGKPAAGQKVVFSATNGARLSATTVTTDAQGLAIVELTNTQPGTAQVTATVNGLSQTVSTTFIADSSTAQITANNLVIAPDNSIADGSATNGVTATVTDAQGNLVSGATVTFSVSSGASITVTKGTTGADGKATANVTSTIAGTYMVTSTVNGTGPTKSTTFIADANTAEITASNLNVIQNNATANGTDTNAVTARVTDANNNPVPGIDVTFSANNGASVVTQTVTTAANGRATTTLTSLTAGASTVTASTGTSSQSVTVNFNPDSSSAIISAFTGGYLYDLSADTTNLGCVSQGTENVSTVKVVDTLGNPVPGLEVSFEVSNIMTYSTSSSITDTNGEVTVTIKGYQAGSTQNVITASLANGNTLSKKLSVCNF